MQIAYNLHSKCKIKNIAYPIKSRKGKLYLKFMDFTLILFNYIEGKNEDNMKLTSKELMNLGELLGKIHASTNQMNLKNRQLFYSEEFNLVKKLERCIKDLKNDDKFRNKYQKKLAKLILPYENELLKKKKEILNLYTKLKKDVVKKPELQVICHRDPISLNFIINKKEEIFLIDWDDAGLALKEQDLWFYLFSRPFPFLKGYEKSIGNFKLNKSAVHFYYQIRLLGDIVDFIQSILYEDKLEKEFKSHIKIIEEWALKDLLRIKHKLTKLNKTINMWNCK